MIDPEAKIRAILYYPLSTGRNFQEIKRLLAALQVTDKYQVSTPADWQPGEDVVVSAPTTLSEVMSEKTSKTGVTAAPGISVPRKFPSRRIKLTVSIKK